MTKTEIQELASLIVTGVVEALQKQNVSANANSNTKSAYQKTEQLLYNYMGFQRIIKEKELEIETLRVYGVPKKSTSIVEYSPGSGTVKGTVLEEDAVDAAVRNVQASVEGTVQVIAMIDKGMESLKTDPYYQVLEMRYFEGRTQEDIAEEFSCTQKTISINKTRLVKELSMRLFPDQAIREMMQ